MITILLVTASVLLLLTLLYDKVVRHHWKYAHIPAIPSRWPILGNVFDMTKTHIVLTDWARRYGPIFRFSLYGEEVVVLNSYEMIYEALVSRGCDVAGRPHMRRTEYGPIFRFSLYGEEVVVLNSYEMIYEALVSRGCDVAGRPHMRRTEYQDRKEHSIVWQTYTPKLQFLRKQIHSSLRMYGDGLSRLQERCDAELTQLLDRVHAQSGQTFDPWSLFYDSACNIMLDLALGVRFPYDGDDLTQMKKINALFNHSFGPGNSRVLDGLPWLRYVTSHEERNLLQQAVHLRDQFWADHKPQKDSGLKGTVISDLRDNSETSKHNPHDISDSTLKETFTNLILAGTDTTTTAITCFLLLLLHYPEVQSTLHVEVDKVLGASRPPKMADRPNMPYLEACLLETLRYISHVPLAVPHATICDTVVGGKTIPKNTTVYINLWALHHDETLWPDPWRFEPTRFLTEDRKLLPPHHPNRRNLMAFGAGRRVCLGEALAKNRLFLFTASLLQRFEFSADENETLPEVDPRTFSLGIVLHPERFKVKAVPRHLDGVICR